MRKLMWFTLGVAAACGLGAYLLGSLTWIAALSGGILTACALLLRHKNKLCLPAMVLLIGMTVGSLWFWGYYSVYLGDVYEVDGTQVVLSAEATDYSRQTEHGASVQARIWLGKKSYRGVIYLSKQHELAPGDRLTGSFRLRMTHEGLEGDTYHRGNGIFVLAYSDETVEVSAADKLPLSCFPAALRRYVIHQLDTLFPEDVAFFPKALLLGDRTGVDYETNTSFKVSGISHIIAVSGLHVSILFSMIYLLSGKQRFLTALLGIPTLLLFAAVAGFTPSITRACVMQILMILAMVLNREYDPPTALSAASLLMLVINPVVITSASFQLSVGCMAGIFLFSGRLQNWICGLLFWREWKGKTLRVRVRQRLASGISVTLSAMVFTTPLVAYYFGSVSLIGVVTNLLTLWAVSWIFYGIIGVCLLSVFWQQGAALVAWCISWLIRYVLYVAKVLSSFPLAAVYTESPFIVLWVLFSYLLIILLLLRKRKQPMLAVCGIATGLCMSLLCSWLLPMTADIQMKVLDVGQGQSILLQSHGRTFLVDCGGDNSEEAADRAAEALLAMGIYRLDGLILTHYDEDHAGGVPGLLYRVNADTVFLPVESDDPAMKQAVLDSCNENAVYVQEDVMLSWADTILQIYPTDYGTSDNERSLCVLFQGENCDILITGDLSSTGENRLILEKNIPKLTGLIAGHHGSASSTGSALLASLEPEYVFISVGADNPYGHPAAQVLERLEKQGCTVYRTDRDGTIVFRR